MEHYNFRKHRTFEVDLGNLLNIVQCISESVWCEMGYTMDSAACRSSILQGLGTPDSNQAIVMNVGRVQASSASCFEL